MCIWPLATVQENKAKIEWIQKFLMPDNGSHRTVGGHLSWWPSLSLHQTFFQPSFLGNQSGRICFLFHMWRKGPDIYTSILSSSLHPSWFLHFYLCPMRLPPRKRPWCVKSETGLIPVSSVHKRVQLCIQNHGKCVCERERERAREWERQKERERERWNEPSFMYKTALSLHLGQPDAFPGKLCSTVEISF